MKTSHVMLFVRLDRVSRERMGVSDKIARSEAIHRI